MSDYLTEVRKIRAAQLEAWRSRAAIRARRKAVARAWDLIPGGKDWDDLLADVNAELPVEAWLTYGTARNDERLGRRRGRSDGVVDDAGAVPGAGPGDVVPSDAGQLRSAGDR